jgi:hypothetical protein
VTPSRIQVPPDPPRRVERRIITEWNGSWRQLGDVTIPGGTPAGAVNVFIGRRLGGFPHLALTTLENSIAIHGITLFHEPDREHGESFAVDGRLDAVKPLLMIDTSGDWIESLEILHGAAAGDVTIEIAGWQPRNAIGNGTDPPPATLVSAMLYASAHQHRFEIGPRHRTFTELWFHGGSACMNVRAVNLTFVGGEEARVTAPGRVADEYGNWPGWGVALPGNTRQLASAVVDYDLDAKDCHHAALSILGR